MKKLSICLVLVSLLGVCGSSMAASYTMKLGWAETADPMDHPCSAAMAVFKDYAENATNGRLEVKLFPAAQLGDAKSMLGQLKRGVIQSCASIPSGMIAGRYYKNMNMFDIPYLFENSTIAWRVINPTTKFFKALAEDMAKQTGIRPLAFFIEGQRHFTNNTRPIEKVEDMKGLKIRTMEVPAHMEMVKAFGASPTPISWPELYGALQTGVIDGQENPIGNIIYAKLFEVQKYMTLDGHVTLLNTWSVNEKWFNNLPEDIKKAILEAASVAEITNRGFSQVREVVGLKEIKSKGTKISTLTAENFAQFRKISQEKVTPYIRENMDDISWIDRLQEEVSKANN